MHTATIERLPEGYRIERAPRDQKHERAAREQSEGFDSARRPRVSQD